MLLLLLLFIIIIIIIIAKESYYYYHHHHHYYYYQSLLLLLLLLFLLQRRVRNIKNININKCLNLIKILILNLRNILDSVNCKITKTHNKQLKCNTIKTTSCF